MKRLIKSIDIKCCTAPKAFRYRSNYLVYRQNDSLQMTAIIIVYFVFRITNLHKLFIQKPSINNLNIAEHNYWYMIIFIDGNDIIVSGRASLVIVTGMMTLHW